MKQRTMALVAAMSMAALMIGGCASNETVKKEEPVVIQAEKAAPVVVKPVEEPKPQPKPEPPKIEQQQPKAAEVEASFETIYFDFDKSDLRQDARNVLSKNAEIMLKNKSDKYKVEGHCDERGSAEYNIALGERRAKSALQYLITLGVQADRLSAVSFGKEKPAVQGNDDAAWSKNRRAEFSTAK